MNSFVAALATVALLTSCAAQNEPDNATTAKPTAAGSLVDTGTPAAAGTTTTAPSPAATLQCQAARHASDAEPLFGRLLVAVNGLDDASALSVVGDYVSQGEFIAEAAVAMCRSPLPTPDENVCRNFTTAGVDLLRRNVAAWQAIDDASQNGAWAEDVDTAHEALEEANDAAGTASAILESSYC